LQWEKTPTDGAFSKPKIVLVTPLGMKVILQLKLAY